MEAGIQKIDVGIEKMGTRMRKIVAREPAPVIGVPLTPPGGRSFPNVPEVRGYIYIGDIYTYIYIYMYIYVIR